MGRPCGPPGEDYSSVGLSEGTRRLTKPSSGMMSSWRLKPLPSWCGQAAPMLVKNPLPPLRSRTWYAMCVGALESTVEKANATLSIVHDKIV